MNTPNHPPPDRYGGPPPGGPYGRPGPYGPPGGQRPGPPPGRPYGPPPGQPYGPPRPRPGGPPPGFGAPGPGRPPGPGGPGPGGYGPPPPPPPPPPPNRFAEEDDPEPPPERPRAARPARDTEPGNNNKLAKVVVLVVVLGVVIGAALWLQSSSPSSAEVGDCIKINDVAAADIDKVDCASQDALYKVAVTSEDTDAGCPAPGYLAYRESGRNELVLCLALNPRTGDCFQVAQDTYKKIDCTSPDATFQVSDVIEGTADPAKCGDGADKALTYPEPPLTICRVAPDGAAT